MADDHGAEDPLAAYARRFARSRQAIVPRLRLTAGLGRTEHLGTGITPEAATEESVVRPVSEELTLPAAAVLGPASYFADLTAARGRRHVRVCTALSCHVATAGGHLPAVAGVLGVAPGARAEDRSVSLQEVRCLGFCYASPAALDGDTPCAGVDLVDQLAGRVMYRDPPVPVVCAARTAVVTAGVVGGEQPWQTWPAVARSGCPEDVLGAVAAAGLRGRGGGGFPTARKWHAALAGAPPRVVVANGDEGDPGSFADRLLMESDPGRVLEGLALACFAIGAESGVLLVRSEYPRALGRLRAALAAAYADGLLGTGAAGGRVRLDLRVVEGAGSYVAGEETALLQTLEGGRGVVRPRPPYPTASGLAGRPTVVNNVQTLAAVPWIVSSGGPAYARLGAARDEPGTVLVCMSEGFAHPGAYEVELGTPMRHLVEGLGGGTRDGRPLRAVQIGGPLGGFLGPTDLDRPLADSGLRSLGLGFGHAGLVALDDRVSGLDVLRQLWRFAEAESCGACSPCRVGSRLAARAARGDVPDSALAPVLRAMENASLCPFGRRLPAVGRSLARIYREELPAWAG